MGRLFVEVSSTACVLESLSNLLMLNRSSLVIIELSEYIVHHNSDIKF